MHVGVSTYIDPRDGGIAQYTSMVFRAMAERPADFAGDTLTLFGTERNQRAAQSYGARFDTMREAPPQSSVATIGRRLLAGGPLRRVARKVYAAQQMRRQERYDANAHAGVGAAGTWMREQGVDVVFSPIYNPFLVELGLPTAIAVHDVQHLIQPHFPESTDRGLWERSEYVLRNAARSRSMMIVAESETGREDLLECYGEHGLTADRIAVVPYTIPPHIRPDAREEEQARVRAKYPLPGRYLFYPAYFFQHKNHARLIEALGLITQVSHERIPLVLSGSYGDAESTRTYREMMRTAERVGVTDQVTYLGFVPDEDMTGLYAGAAALVMPSLFGPTNVPLIEAWALGCPVVTSNLRGIREMCGDAALLVAPGSVEDIALAMLAVWTNGALAAALAERGAMRAEQFSPARFRDAYWAMLRQAKALA
ncbi:MAG: glycosyltransferase family 1 protein [Gemmatimonadaceae bacterium]